MIGFLESRQTSGMISVRKQGENYTHRDAAVEALLTDGDDSVLAIILEPETKNNMYARWRPRADTIVIGATFAKDLLHNFAPLANRNSDNQSGYQSVFSGVNTVHVAHQQVSTVTLFLNLRPWYSGC